MSDRDQLAKLSAENAELRSRLEAVENKITPKPRPAPPVEEGVRITYPRICPIEMPTTEQLRDLLRIVKRTYPTLVPDFDDRSVARDFGNAFIGSFEIISNIKRTATLDKRGADHWASNATRWLDARGDRGIEVSIGAYMAAVCAAGDIAYSIGEYASGYRVGLTYDGGAAATADAWRRVLATGQVRAAIQVEPQRRAPQLSQVRIYGG